MTVDLLLLPGMLSDVAVWAPQIAALRDLSAPRVADYGDLDSIEAMAQAALADAPPRFALAGHSMGGRVALEICRRAPERVMALGLFGTDYRRPVDDAERAMEAGRRAKVLAWVAAEGMVPYARAWARRVVMPPRRDDAALIDAIVAMTIRHTPAQLAAHSLAGLNRPDFSHVLTGIACPTLIVAGSGDNVRSVETHRDMAARIARAERVVLDSCGHMMTLEQPAEMARTMRRWLAM